MNLEEKTSVTMKTLIMTILNMILQKRDAMMP